jgi:hypothetical protein
MIARIWLTPLEWGSSNSLGRCMPYIPRLDQRWIPSQDTDQEPCRHKYCLWCGTRRGSISSKSPSRIRNTLSSSSLFSPLFHQNVFIMVANDRFWWFTPLQIATTVVAGMNCGASTLQSPLVSNTLFAILAAEQHP